MIDLVLFILNPFTIAIVTLLFAAGKYREEKANEEKLARQREKLEQQNLDTSHLPVPEDQKQSEVDREVAFTSSYNMDYDKDGTPLEELKGWKKFYYRPSQRGNIKRIIWTEHEKGVERTMIALENQKDDKKRHVKEP